MSTHQRASSRASHTGPSPSRARVSTTQATSVTATPFRGVPVIILQMWFWHRSSIEAKIRKAENGVLALARARFPSCKVFSIGAVDIDPKRLAIWITTDTDAQRDALRGDAGFQLGLRSVLREVRYPEAAIGEVGFAVESEETVQRDCEGNWWYAIK